MSHLVTLNSSGSSETSSKILQVLSQVSSRASYRALQREFSCGGDLCGEDKPAGPCQHAGPAAWFAGPMAEIMQGFPAVGGERAPCLVNLSPVEIKGG